MNGKRGIVLHICLYYQTFFRPIVYRPMVVRCEREKKRDQILASATLSYSPNSVHSMINNRNEKFVPQRQAAAGAVRLSLPRGKNEPGVPIYLCVSLNAVIKDGTSEAAFSPSLLGFCFFFLCFCLEKVPKDQQLPRK